MQYSLVKKLLTEIKKIKNKNNTKTSQNKAHILHKSHTLLCKFFTLFDIKNDKYLVMNVIGDFLKKLIAQIRSSSFMLEVNIPTL